MPRTEESATNRELALLLRAIDGLTAPPGARAARLAPADVEALDWTELVRLARWHRCEALLDQALSSLPSPAGMPSAAADALHRAARGSAVRGARVEQLLADLHAVLAAAGIPFLLLKGPALAHTAYTQPALRPYDDLDLLLRPADIPRAAAMLQAAGYRPLHPMDEADLRRQVQAGWDHGLRDPSGLAIVELCTGVAPRFFARPPTEALWQRAGRVAIAGADIATPCAADLLLLLALHGAKHAWSRLLWVADVAGLLARHGAEALVRAAEAPARSAGCSRMLWLALELAGHRADAATGLPGGDPTVRHLAQRVRARWQAGLCEEPSGIDERRFHLGSRERLRDRLRYASLLAFTPSHGDRQWVRLPGPLYPLYYLLRPIRLTLAAATQLLRARLGGVSR